ncbi:MAG: TonB-dependent receptor [Anaerophaga sp.]|uniref:carboxypeptidase-like regulatory domain-containing protein n=1 Tax=Anaerophaga thermohalophila TaxID=177400 RepID=UPI000237BADA|nr:carboxypeptidase-like regulatory domain-containing protein [Anaerophaga thermohalophila]MBZ4675621.1 TonB-dependent receptor [Anaerophaga sp.]MDK2842635.1 hypothetical protein [Anaerophaga sp.]
MKALLIILSLVASVSMTALAGSNDKTENPGEPVAVNTCISGTIIDEETGEALTGVEVKLDGTETKTYTDFDGKFFFDKVKPGDYSVQVNYISYQPVVRNIRVHTNEMHALNLELENVDSE